MSTQSPWQAPWQSLREQHPKATDGSHSDNVQACIIPLTEHVLITVTGPDAETFLQGQCTCDFNALAQQHCVLGAHCTAKGRMNCSFHAAYLADEHTIGLRVHQSVATFALAALKKYAVFSKVTLEISENYHIFAAFHADEPHTALPAIGQFQYTDTHTCIQHDQQLTEYWVTHHALQQTLSPFASYPITSDDNLWQLLNIRRGIAEVKAPLQEQLLPQEMNFQLTNGVSFKKGCYTGQEIVARLHYRGKLKKHMARARISHHSAPEIGSQVLASADNEKPQGMLLNVAYSGDNEYEALILCDDSLLNSNTCTLQENSSANIQWLTLPYAIN